jgi:predicted nucleic acid-binding protein
MANAIVVTNAGPLIALGKLNRLDLLAGLFGQVRIPRAVYEEVVLAGLARGAADARAVQLFCQQQKWPIVEVPDSTMVAYVPEVILDPGEIEVLAFAQTVPDALVLLDDEVARAEARRLRLGVRGTLGILVQGYRADLLSLAQVELLIREIAVRPDIWIGAKLCEEVLASLPIVEKQDL